VADQTIPVTLHLPARTWWRLAKIAEHEGLSVAQLLARGAADIERLRAQHRPRSTTRDQIVTLREAGLSAPEIAARLHCSRSNVYQHLRRDIAAASTRTGPA
jgi:DNA-binding NarL/FixJ family response regulator